MIGIAEKEVEMAFKLYLECAIIADQCNTIVRERNIESKGCDFGVISYEFMAQSFLLYEDQISDPKMRERSITLIVGTLLSFKSFVKSDYEALSAKTTQYAAKLIRKPDQCKMILLCSNLFYRGCSQVSDALSYLPSLTIVLTWFRQRTRFLLKILREFLSAFREH